MSLVQANHNATNIQFSDLNVTLASNVTVGNILVASLWWQLGTDTPVVDHDSLSNVWAAATAMADGGSSRVVRLFWAPITTGGSCTITVPATGAAESAELWVGEFSGGYGSVEDSGIDTSGAFSKTLATSVGSLVFAAGISSAAISADTGAGYTSAFGGSAIFFEKNEYKAATVTSTVADFTTSGTGAMAAASFALSIVPPTIQLVGQACL